jgi:hypothetical protein
MAEPSTSVEQSKVRGIILTLWLAAMVFLSLWIILHWWNIYTNSNQNWQLLIPIALTVVQLIGVAALWLRKFWGLWLVIGGWALVLIYLFVISLPLNVGLISGISVVILFVLVIRKREHFD